MPGEDRRGHLIPGAGAKDSPELPNAGAGNTRQALCGSNLHNRPLSHLSSSSVTLLACEEYFRLKSSIQTQSKL